MPKTNYQLEHLFQMPTWRLKKWLDGLSDDALKELVADLVEGRIYRCPKADESTGESSNGQRKYTPLLTIDEILSQPDSRADWLVESIVLAHGLTIVGGLPGHGKSLFSQFLARAVASGEPFLGKFASRPGPVLVVDREVPTLRLKKLAAQASCAINVLSASLFFYFCRHFYLRRTS